MRLIVFIFETSFIVRYILDQCRQRPVCVTSSIVPNCREALKAYLDAGTVVEDDKLL